MAFGMRGSAFKGPKAGKGRSRGGHNSKGKACHGTMTQAWTRAWGNTSLLPFLYRPLPLATRLSFPTAFALVPDL